MQDSFKETKEKPEQSVWAKPVPASTKSTADVSVAERKPEEVQTKKSSKNSAAQQAAAAPPRENVWDTRREQMAAARSSEDISVAAPERERKASTPQYERPPSKKARDER